MAGRTVITGVGLLCSLGQSAQQTWEALVQGRSGIGPVTGFPAGGFGAGTAAQASVPGPRELGINAKDFRIMDKHTYMLVKCASDALDDAGLSGPSIPREQYSFFAGMGMVDYRVEDLMPAVLKSMDPDGSVDYDRFYESSYMETYPLWPLSMLNNVSFCQVTIMLGIKGDNTVYSPHAEAGAQALYEAAMSVAEGRAAVSIGAGVGENVTAQSMARAAFSGTLSTSGRCMPFCAGRDGNVPGEGCAAIVMQAEPAAAQMGRAPLAVLSGYGEAFGTRGYYCGPDAGAYERAMGQALREASLEPGDIDVIVANGEGTAEGDRNEAEAIGRVFSHGPLVYCSKGALGNMLAGGSAVDAALAVYMINTGVVPPTLGAGEPDGSLGLNVARGGALRKKVRRVMVNSGSYEGQCSSLIVEAAR